MLDAAALGIVGGEVEAADPGEGDRLRAHRTGLERHLEIAAGEARRAQPAAAAARITSISACAVGSCELLDAVAGAGEDLPAAVDEHRADRHLAAVAAARASASASRMKPGSITGGRGAPVARLAAAPNVLTCAHPSSASPSMPRSPAATRSFPGMRCARTMRAPSSRRRPAGAAAARAGAGGCAISSCIDGLIVTGGAFDVDPALFGADGPPPDGHHQGPRAPPSSSPITRGALDRDKPVLGICGGQQLLHVVLGGTPDPAHPGRGAGRAGPRAAQSARRAGAHRGASSPARGCTPSSAPTSSGQQRPSPGGEGRAGRRAWSTPSPPDGVIEGIEAPARRFCIGVQWHPEFSISAGDRALFAAFVDAARQAAWTTARDPAEAGRGERIAKVIAAPGCARGARPKRGSPPAASPSTARCWRRPACVVGDGRSRHRRRQAAAGRGRCARLWRYHKPAGLVTTQRSRRAGRRSSQQLPPELGRVISVGRLDLTSEGLLLLTNDGELARRLELPATGWIRRYRVRAHGSVDAGGAGGARRAASPSTASATGRSRRRSTGSRAPTSG